MVAEHGATARLVTGLCVINEQQLVFEGALVQVIIVVCGGVGHKRVSVSQIVVVDEGKIVPISEVLPGKGDVLHLVSNGI